MDAVIAATALDIIGQLTDEQWTKVQAAENNRRSLVNTSFTPNVGTPAPTAQTPTVNTRVQFVPSTKPLRIAGRTGLVTEILSKGNVKIKLDGTGEVFTRVGREAYAIVPQEFMAPATQKAQRRSSRYAY